MNSEIITKCKTLEAQVIMCTLKGLNTKAMLLRGIIQAIKYTPKNATVNATVNTTVNHQRNYNGYNKS